MNDVIERIAMARQVISIAQGEVLRLLPDCRERSLVLTKLDEARLWLIEGIASPEADHTPR